MTKRFPVVVFHNPKCTTSINVVDMIKAAGHKPTIIEYLKSGWTEPQLLALFAAADLTPREALRDKAKEAGELGLLAPKISDEKILDAMVAYPVLVERPFVATPKGVRLCRPKEKVREVL